MNKRMIAGLMTISVLFGAAVCPAAVITEKAVISASAEEKIKNDGEFVYCLTDDHKGIKILRSATWQEDNRGLEAVRIPEIIDGLPVKEIGDDCFSTYSKLKKVMLPDSIEVIGERAFFDCHNLTSINMPSDLKKIGENAFMYVKLKKVVLPDGFRKIGKTAFYGNDGLTITIPESVTYIHENAFQDAKDVTIKGYKGSYAEEFVKKNNVRAEKLQYTFPITFVDVNAKQKGDISGDGNVTITDISMLSAHIKGKKLLEDESAADVNGDGKVTITDISLVAAHVKGKKSLG